MAGGGKKVRYIELGSVLLAALAGAVMAATALVSAGGEPFSVRFYSSGSDLVRIAAFDKDTGMPAPLKEIRLRSQDNELQWPCNGALFKEIPSLPYKGNHLLTIETGKGRRTFTDLHFKYRAENRDFTIKPVSTEFAEGPEARIGIGTEGVAAEYDNKKLLSTLDVIPYPEQGRLRSNLPNGIILYARGCPGSEVEIETSNGSGRIQTDRFGMARFVFTPTLGGSWVKTGCGDKPVRIPLKDSPGGVVMTAKKHIFKPGETAELEVETLLAGSDYTLDIFNDCRWTASQQVHVKDGHATASYEFGNAPGLYSFEIYGNVNYPGSDRATVHVMVAEDSPAVTASRYLHEIKDDSIDPVTGPYKAIAADRHGLEKQDQRLLASAFLSRIDHNCGPPPLVLDTAPSDAAGIAKKRGAARSRGMAGLTILWGALVAGIFLHMAFSLRSHAVAEEKLEGQGRSTVVLHITAAAVLTVAFALLMFTINVWLG